MKVKECTLVDDSLRRLRKASRICVSCEVPILGRNVDLAYLTEEEVYTVEFKLRDWRRAIRQARDHLLGTDYAYICMPRRKVSDAMMSELERVGVGLLFFCDEGDWPFEEIVEAPRSQVTSEIARKWTVEYIQNNEGQRTWQKTDQ